jgi:hypothetical protein
VPGVEAIRLFGRVTPSATEKTVWNGTSHVWATANVDFSLKSSSANDDGAPVGTGAQTVRVWWLDVNNIEATVDVVMNGVAQVASGVVTMRRVNKAQVLASGPNGVNDGNVTVEVTGGVQQYAYIPGRLGTSMGCCQTVPAGKRDWITDVAVNDGDDNTENSYWFKVRTSPTAPWVTKLQFQQENLGCHLDYPVRIDAGSDYEITVIGGQHGSANIFGFRETL